MRTFSRLFRRLFQKGETRSDAPSARSQQAVLAHLDGTTLPDEVYQQHDLATIEDRLIEVLAAADAGEFDGNEIGPTETTLFMYGEDAERLFSSIEPVLRAYPLCRNARIEIRRGGPGAPQRELRLPPA